MMQYLLELCITTYTYSTDEQNWPYYCVYNNVAIILWQIVPDF